MRFYYKMLLRLVQNGATLITKCVSYYKMRRLLQNAAEQNSDLVLVPEEQTPNKRG